MPAPPQALTLDALPGLTEIGLRGGMSVTALVGGGGKTTLMFALARALNRRGLTVVCTTTTRIFPPRAEQTGALLTIDPHAASPSGALWKALRKALDAQGHVTLAGRLLADGKLRGLSPAQMAALAGVRPAHAVLVEADGAAGRPLKAPAPHEPAVPPQTTLCVALLGLDGLGRRLNEAAHRPESALKLCGLPPDAGHTTVLPEHLACLALHGEGLFRACPASARRVVLCHKADMPGGLEAARRTALAARRLYPAHPAAWWAGSAHEGWLMDLS